MLGIGKEISIFLSSCLTGNLVCLIYLSLRVLRRIIKHSLLWVSIEDFLYWIGITLYIFVEMYRTCQGNIRWYFVLGVSVGIILTIFIVRKIKKALIKIKKQGKMKLENEYKKG